MISYFKPKKFEMIQGRSVYSYLGVRFFKKYLLLTDLILFRLRNKKQICIRDKGLVNELKRLEWQTRRDEVMHMFFSLLVVLILFENWKHLSPVQIVIIFILNLYANIYPIFVQRYNRSRLLTMLTRLSN